MSFKFVGIPQEFRTYFVVRVYEPELGFVVDNINLMSNLMEHVVDFEEYLLTVSAASINPIELEYPSERQPGNYFPSNDIASIADYANWARGRAEVNQVLRSIFIHRAPVKITFENGWSVYIMIEARSTVHQLIMITDDNGNIVETHVDYGSGNSGGASPGGGGAQYGNVSINITIPSGGGGGTVTMCTAIEGHAAVCQVMHF